MTTGTRLDVTPVSGALGAEVRGIDLSDLSDEGFAAVHAALLEHLVLFFPDQHLTPDEHRAFAVRFGEPEIHPFIPKLDDDHPEIVVLDQDERADMWHTDCTFSEHPPICSVLRMVALPDRGGDTIWTNQYRAYETLSAPMRDLVDGLTAVHSRGPINEPPFRAEHPAVRVHPETGRRSLYVNRAFTHYFLELSPAESRVLLAYLCDHSELPANTCRYQWTPGTIAVWDNRVTQHYAVNDYDGGRRIERVTILGDDPVGDPPRWSPYTGIAEGFDRHEVLRRRAAHGY